MRPWHFGHVSASVMNTRFKRSAQGSRLPLCILVISISRDSPVPALSAPALSAPAASGAGGAGGVGTTLARSLAAGPRMPWYRTRWQRGRGINGIKHEGGQFASPCFQIRQERRPVFLYRFEKQGRFGAMAFVRGRARGRVSVTACSWLRGKHQQELSATGRTQLLAERRIQRSLLPGCIPILAPRSPGTALSGCTSRQLPGHRRRSRSRDRARDDKRGRGPTARI